MRRIAHHAGIKPRDARAVGRRHRLAATGFAIAALLLPALQPPQLRLVWNVSPSVPTGLYRIATGAAPRPGDLVAVRLPPGLADFMAERRYVEAGALLIKPVAAGAGATVCRHGATVTIDGAPVALARDRDRLDRPLPRWSGCLQLGAEQLFLIAPATPGSFDSRYFGPIDRAAIVGRALPVWTRS